MKGEGGGRGNRRGGGGIGDGRRWRREKRWEGRGDEEAVIQMCKLEQST